MPQNNELKVLISAEVDKYIANLNKASQSTNSFGNSAKALSSGINNLFNTLGVGFGVYELVNGLKQAYLAAEEVTKTNAKLDSVLKATGYSAGLTSSAINDMASNLMEITGVDDEVIKSAQTVLLTFRNIGSDVFPEATKAMLDMSAVMGQDLQSSAVQLGKALNDPIEGVSALRRVGVQLTQQQEGQIKAFIKSGQGLKAQKIILEELEKEFGGAAEASKTFSQEVTTGFGNLEESIGSFLEKGVGAGFSQWLIDTTQGWQYWIDKVRVATSAINDLSISELHRKRGENWSKEEELSTPKKNIFGKEVPISAAEAAERYNLEEEDKKIEKRIQELQKLENRQKQAGKQKKAFNLGSESKAKKESTIKIDKETIGYGDITEDFRQNLKEAQERSKAEKDLLYKELNVKAELRKKGLLDESRDFRDELALRIDHAKRVSGIEQQIAKESADAINQIEKKRRDDVLNFQNGHAVNSKEAIQAANEAAKKQIEAVNKLAESRKKALLEENQKLTDAKRATSKDDKAAYEAEAGRNLVLVKQANANAIIMGEQELADRQRAIYYQTIQEKEQIEIAYIEKKKNLDLQQLNLEIEVNKLKGAELTAIQEQKANIEAEAQLKIANAKQTAREAELQKEREFYSQLGDISGNYLELYMTHQLTMVKIQEMAQVGIRQAVIGGLKAMFEDKKRAELAEAFMSTKKAAIEGWTKGLAMAPAPFNLATAAGMAAASAAFPAANMAMIAASNYREHGGPVNAGEAYIVGEKRPEIFVPNTSGRIIPNTNALNGGLSDGQQASQNIVIAINPSFKNLDPAEGQKMFDKWMDTAGLPKVVNAIKYNTGNMRQTIKAIS